MLIGVFNIFCLFKIQEIGKLWLNFGARSFGCDLPLSFLKPQNLSPLPRNQGTAALSRKYDIRVKHGPNDSIFVLKEILSSSSFFTPFDRRSLRN
jgi:hypothetical protein